MVLKKDHILFCLGILFGLSTYGQKTIKELYQVFDQQFQTGKYDEALITSLKALRIAEKHKNCNEIALAYLNVGRMEYYIIHKPVAISYFFKSLKVLEECPNDSLKNILYSNLGAVFTDLGKTDSALIYLKKSKEALEKTNNHAGISKVNAVLADLYFGNLKDAEGGEKFLLMAEKHAALSLNKSAIAFASIKRGIFHSLKKEYPLALKAYKVALNNYEEIGQKEGRRYALGMILDILKQTDHSELNLYWNKYTSLRDSMYHGEMAAKIAEYQTLYKTEKKESENKLLQQKNKLSQIELEAKNRTIAGLVVGVLLIIITVFWRISVLNLRKKNRELEAAQAMQKEKERISRDLHDNVGGQLSYVLFSLDGMNELDTPKRAELTSNINESVRNVINNLRETIWAINDESISIQDLSDKLKVYARNMFKNRETLIRFSESIVQNLAMNSAVGLNVYRICQEIINNAFKHAQAKELIISISSNQEIEITIKDDGIGFNKENVSNTGLGLRNLENRATEAGIKLSCEAQLHKGVSYTLIV